MGFRFRRRFSIGPGLRLNLSKSGVSASVGHRGAWLTIGARGARETVGIPGTGLSYTEQQSIGELPATAAGNTSARASSSGSSHPLIWLALLALIAVALAIWL